MVDKTGLNMSEAKLSGEEAHKALTALNGDEATCSIDRAMGVVDLLITQFQIKTHERADDEACLNALWSIRNELQFLESEVQNCREATIPLYLRIFHGIEA